MLGLGQVDELGADPHTISLGGSYVSYLCLQVDCDKEASTFCHLRGNVEELDSRSG